MQTQKLNDIIYIPREVFNKVVIYVEKVVLIIGGLFKSLKWTDLFFFISSLILILLIVYIIYLIKSENSNEEIVEEEIVEKDEKKSLVEIIDNLQNNYEPKPIDLTDYEKELENTAIISYDELVKRSSQNISYEDNYESGFDDLTVKKVTTESNTQELVDLPKAVMLRYDNEEAFLQALKKLQDNLVR